MRCLLVVVVVLVGLASWSRAEGDNDKVVPDDHLTEHERTIRSFALLIESGKAPVFWYVRYELQ